MSHQGRLSNICVPGSEINIVLIDKTVYDVKCGSCRRSVARENPPAALDIDLGAGDSVLGALLFNRVKMSVVELPPPDGGGGGVAAAREARVYHIQCAVRMLYRCQSLGTPVAQLMPFMMAGGRLPAPLLRAIKMEGVTLKINNNNDDEASSRQPLLKDLPELYRLDSELSLSVVISLSDTELRNEKFTYAFSRVPMTFSWRDDCVFRVVDMLLEAAHTNVVGSPSDINNNNNIVVAHDVVQFLLPACYPSLVVHFDIEKTFPGSRINFGSLRIDYDALRLMFDEVNNPRLAQLPLTMSRSIVLAADSEHFSVAARMRIIAERKTSKPTYYLQVLDVFARLSPYALLVNKDNKESK
jgi:hypothetical protein